MIFTKNDLKKIELYLKENSWKDSKFKVLDNVTGNEKIPVLTDNDPLNDTKENKLMSMDLISDYVLEEAFEDLSQEVLEYIKDYIATPTWGTPLTHIHHSDDDGEINDGQDTFTANATDVNFNFDCLIKNSDSEDVTRIPHSVALPKATTTNAGIVGSDLVTAVNNATSTLATVVPDLQEVKNEVFQSVELADLDINKLNDYSESIIFSRGSSNRIDPGIYTVYSGSGIIRSEVGTLYYYRRPNGGMIQVDTYCLIFITRTASLANNEQFVVTNEDCSNIYITWSKGLYSFAGWKPRAISIIDLEYLNNSYGGTNILQQFGLLYVTANDKIVGLLYTVDNDPDHGAWYQYLWTCYVENGREFSYDSEDTEFKTYTRKYLYDDRRPEEAVWDEWERTDSKYRLNTSVNISYLNQYSGSNADPDYYLVYASGDIIGVLLHVATEISGRSFHYEKLITFYNYEEVLGTKTFRKPTEGSDNENPFKEYIRTRVADENWSYWILDEQLTEDDLANLVNNNALFSLALANFDYVYNNGELEINIYVPNGTLTKQQVLDALDNDIIIRAIDDEDTLSLRANNVRLSGKWVVPYVASNMTVTNWASDNLSKITLTISNFTSLNNSLKNIDSNYYKTFPVKAVIDPVEYSYVDFYVTRLDKLVYDIKGYPMEVRGILDYGTPISVVYNNGANAFQVLINGTNVNITDYEYVSVSGDAVLRVTPSSFLTDYTNTKAFNTYASEKALEVKEECFITTDVHKVVVHAELDADDATNKTLIVLFPNYNKVKETQRDASGGLEFYGTLTDGTAINTIKLGNDWYLYVSGTKQSQKITDWTWDNYELTISLYGSLNLEAVVSNTLTVSDLPSLYVPATFSIVNLDAVFAFDIPNFSQLKQMYGPNGTLDVNGRLDDGTIVSPFFPAPGVSLLIINNAFTIPISSFDWTSADNKLRIRSTGNASVRFKFNTYDKVGLLFTKINRCTINTVNSTGIAINLIVPRKFPTFSLLELTDLLHNETNNLSIKATDDAVNAKTADIAYDSVSGTILITVTQVDGTTTATYTAISTATTSTGIFDIYTIQGA